MYSENILKKEVLFKIVETSVDAIIIINTYGIMEYVNKATELMFLHEREAMIGQNVSMLMPEPDAANHDIYMQKYMKYGHAKIIGIGREVVSMKKDGSLFNCLLSISEIKTDNLHLFTGVLHDISALKQAERDLLEANKNLEARVEDRTEKLNDAVNKLLAINTELKTENALRKQTEMALKRSEEDLLQALSKEKELNELKSRFVSMASHEFRTPLSTILSSANLLEKYIDNMQLDKTENHLVKINKAVSHLNSVLSDFLMLGKWEEGKIKLEISTFHWNTLVKELKDILELNVKKGQELVLHNADVLFTTDYNLLKNALINILSNALKYSFEETIVEMTLSNIGNLAKIAVKDQGIGIPLSEQNKIFERFFRAGNINAIDGTGLGLSIVKLYMEKLNGSVTFSSEVNKGSTFFIEIPINISQYAN